MFPQVPTDAPNHRGAHSITDSIAGRSTPELLWLQDGENFAQDNLFPEQEYTFVCKTDWKYQAQVCTALAAR